MIVDSQGSMGVHGRIYATAAGLTSPVVVT
jgi:hypothetical protein